MRLRLNRLGAAAGAGIIALALMIGCSPNPSRPQAVAARGAPAAAAFVSVERPGLPNAHIVRAHLIAGAQPEGDAGFQALRDLGIRTIISVDGSSPDVEMARKYGMRYVHLPITYATVTRAQGEAIAKAIDTLPGPIYLHCHHGKHRAAAAVAVACVFDGTLKPEQAESVLKTFGTGQDYIGLWQAARDARPVDPREIRDLQIKFVEIQKIPELADSMVLMDAEFDRMKEIQKAGWQTPAHHPDLDPPHEALLLQEHFRELQRLRAVKEKPADFQKRLAEAEREAVALKELLKAPPVDGRLADAAMKTVGASCGACHNIYRNRVTAR